MTTQTAVLAAESGRTLTAKLFTIADPDTVAFTADSVTERTNAKGEYVCTFGEASVIIGDHKLILFYGTKAAAIGFVTFAGTDAETATETPIARVTLVDTCTTNTDMRGTNSAATAANLTALQAVADKIATVIYGTVTGAGTATEVFTSAGYTVTVSVLPSGDRTQVVIT